MPTYKNSPITRLSAIALCMAIVLITVNGCTHKRGSNLVTSKHIHKFLFEQNSAHINIPEGVETREILQRYPIPGGAPAPHRLKDHVEMPSPLINPISGNIRIQSLNHYSWLLADISPPQIWPRIRSFISINNLPLAEVNIKSGVIVTKWLQPQESLPDEKYRIWVEPGMRDNTSEIHLLQTNKDVFKNNKWPKTSANKERAKLMLDGIATYLVDVSQTPVAVSLGVSKFQPKPRMRTLVDKNGASRLIFDIDFDRVWAALDLALGKAEIAILDINRNQGIYYIAYDAEHVLLNLQAEYLDQTAKETRDKKNKGRAKDKAIKGRASIGNKDLIKRTKNLPKAQIKIIKVDKEITVYAETTDDEENKATIEDLNAIIKTIAAFIS